MSEDYRKIEFVAGNSIDYAVKELLSHNENGIMACGEFNGITLYSDSVTLDSAYKEITGKTKAEFEQGLTDWRASYDKEEREHKERIPELSKAWIEKGREVLTEDKWELWEEIVPFRLNDLYRGMELGNCLDIVKVLSSNGTFDEAKKMLSSQGHSGMSYGLVCSMIVEFCERGNEFIEYIK